ncbi:RNA exonuclease 3 [Lignoscripta atroalba]|nr:RNA exonuclease 3 [Lignoscripta atroalba]
MFSSTGLFSQVVCPEGTQCHLLSCIFSHASVPASNAISKATAAPGLLREQCADSGLDEDGHRSKKRRIEGHYKGDSSRLAVATDTTTDPPALSHRARATTPSHGREKKPEAGSGIPPSAVREISPPSTRSIQFGAGSTNLSKGPSTVKLTSSANGTSKAVNVECRESLNPRLMNKPPATHAVRLKLTTMLHEQMLRLNEEVKASQHPAKAALELSPQELIMEALGEEQKIAKENYSVYANVLKLRIVALKKMKLDDWTKERLKHIAREYPEEKPLEVSITPATLKTGLSSAEELALLPKLVTQQDDLAKHGYVPFVLSEAEVEQARRGVEASQGWEQCDRCQSRFQVFPGRRADDGALTTGGKCSYHYGKPRRPTREKADTGHRDSVYLCCGQSLGTSGCTTADTHVFKVSNTNRLGAVMPFMKTPVKGSQIPESAVCFDCEMGYTTLGMELIRLTATSWPKGDELLDVLVRPMGEVLDLNSRFSGVWPKHFKDAIPHDGKTESEDAISDKEESAERQLRLVESPARARDLLFKYLTTTTPLIGHAIENDLNAARIIHPTIIDTVLLYPHPRGLPIRYGLKMLVKKYLNRNIQMGGAQGHDSKEDARAAGDLVRLKVGETWKRMGRDGWTVEDGVFYPPLPSEPTAAKPPRVLRSDEARMK